MSRGKQGLPPILEFYPVAKWLNAAVMGQITRNQSEGMPQSDSCYHWISTADWLPRALQVSVDPTGQLGAL